MQNAILEIEQLLKYYKSIYSDSVHLNGQLSAVEFTKEEIRKPVVNQAPQKRRVSTSKVPAQQSPELQQFYLQIKDCTKCQLSETRKNFVFGFGNPTANLMLVGEAPGQEEDETGIPFVGRAGQLLDKMLYAIGLNRDQIFIANILKCRPPQNRDPLPDEIVKCEPYLHQQIDMIKPKVILALGRVAGQNLLKIENSLSQLRESEHRYKDTPLIVTYHPAALLRNPRWKQNSWRDLQKVKKLITNT